MEEQAQHLGTAVAIFRTGAAAPAAAPAAPRKAVGPKRAPVRAAAAVVETEWETF
jgi:methyl-accepting chemotaxis protein